jgi:hypothetical protein
VASGEVPLIFLLLAASSDSPTVLGEVGQELQGVHHGGIHRHVHPTVKPHHDEVPWALPRVVDCLLA